MTVVAATNWTPSPSRMAAWPQYAGSGTRNSLPAQLPTVWPTKGPADQLDYVLDLDGWLAEGGDALVLSGLVSIAASDGASGPADLDVVWSTLLAGRPVLMLAGGRPGITYAVAVSLRTAARRRVVPVAMLSIGAGISAPAVPAPVVQSCQVALTDPSGAVLMVAPGVALTVDVPVAIAAAAGAPTGPAPPNLVTLGQGRALTVAGIPLIYA